MLRQLECPRRRSACSGGGTPWTCRTLRSYGIQRDSVIFASLRLRGGVRRLGEEGAAAPAPGAYSKPQHKLETQEGGGSVPTSGQETGQSNTAAKQDAPTHRSATGGASPQDPGLSWAALEVVAFLSLPKVAMRSAEPTAKIGQEVRTLVANIAKREGLPAHVVRRDLVGPALQAEPQKCVPPIRYTRYRTAAELLTCRLCPRHGDRQLRDWDDLLQHLLTHHSGSPLTEPVLVQLRMCFIQACKGCIS